LLYSSDKVTKDIIRCKL